MIFFRFDSTINRLRSIGFWEALSYLLLLIVAMPLKYLWHLEIAVQVMGMLHGLFWMAYIGLAMLGQHEGYWTLRTTLLLFVASLIPFGPFVADARLIRPLQAKKYPRQSNL